eukprot:1145413-Pelagomonas_calceolata.AAC.10
MPASMSVHIVTKSEVTSIPAVLDRLKQFIPRIQEANQELEQQLQGSNPRDFDIEGVEEGQEGGYIEMRCHHPTGHPHRWTTLLWAKSGQVAELSIPAPIYWLKKGCAQLILSRSWQC